MSQPTCSCLLQRYPRNNQTCGKEAKFSVDCNDTSLYLCKYHSTRYLQGKRTIFSRMNYPLGFCEPVLFDPKQGWIRKWGQYKVDPPASFLPDDCWKVIIGHLPKCEQYLAKFVCKLWAEIIGKKCCEFIFGNFLFPKFTEVVDYLGVKNIGKIDTLYRLPIDHFKYLLEKGCYYSDDLFESVVACGYIDKITCLLDTGYRPHHTTHEKLITCNELVYNLCKSHGIHVRCFSIPPIPVISPAIRPLPYIGQ